MKMDFKNRKIDELALMADLVSREANDRSAALTSALRRIEILQDGYYGEGRPDVRLIIALGAGFEAAVDRRTHDRNASLSELVEEVGELVDSAEQVFDERDCIVGMLKEVRTALSREVSKAKRRGLPYRILDVSLTPSQAGSYDLPAAEIAIEFIGPLLDAERCVFAAESAQDVVHEFAGMRETQERLLAMRDRLDELDADVAIDPITLAALEDAGITPDKAVADLRESKINIIDVDARHGTLILYVDKGVVTGNVPLGEGLRWQEGCLFISKSRGICVKDAKGQALSRLVPHAYIGDGLNVFSAGEVGDDLWLRALPQPVALSLEEKRRAA